MTKAEFESLGLTTEAVAESTIEVPEIAETATETAEETSTTEVAAEATEEATKTEATVAAIVPAEAKAEVIATGAAMSFANIKAAAEYLANELSLKVSNTLDGLYKTKRRGSNKNHGYIVTFNEDKTVQLAKTAQ